MSGTIFQAVASALCFSILLILQNFCNIWWSS